ncbi:MAG: T9SS type A sorting domain-containing protein [Candidatus Hatepunaea meridiana]|nr:T9SS type A sorting domain-containing protein [Candidatus Hatepunaea meridiana]
MNPPQFDDIRDYEIAVSLMNRGRYEDAVNSFQRFIARNREDRHARKALKHIYFCTKRSEGNLIGLRRSLSEMADANSENYPELAWKARRVGYKCDYAAGNIDEAIRSAEALIEQAPNRVASIYIQIDVLLMRQEELEGIDALTGIDIDIIKLEDSLEDAMAMDKLDMIQAALPNGFQVLPAYPNPFNSSTIIHYLLPESENVVMSIYDIKGRNIIDLVNGPVQSGNHSITWEGHNVPTGIYYCKVSIPGQEKTIKLTLIR